MQNLFIKELGIKYLSECLNRYNATTGFVLLYICLVLFIIARGYIFKRNNMSAEAETDKLEKLTFVPITIIMIITVFNPVFPVILAKFTDVSNEYYRFFWIAPVIVLVPYMLTKLISKVFNADEEHDEKTENKGTYKALLCLFVVAILFASSAVYIKEFKLAENIYKIPDELIDVVNIIHNDSDDEYTKAYFDYEYNMMVRQYDPKMLLTIDRENYIFAATNDYSTDEIYDNEHPEYRILAALFRYQPVDNDALKEGFDLTGTEYIVLRNGSTNIERLLSIGLDEVAKTETYTVLKYSLLEKKPFELVDYSEVYENGW